MADQKFNTKIQANEGIELKGQPFQKALQIDSNGNVESSVVTTTELANVSGTTSSIQGQIDTVISDTQAELALKVSIIDSIINALIFG